MAPAKVSRFVRESLEIISTLAKILIGVLLQLHDAVHVLQRVCIAIHDCAELYFLARDGPGHCAELSLKFDPVRLDFIAVHLQRRSGPSKAKFDVARLSKGAGDELQEARDEARGDKPCGVPNFVRGHGVKCL